VRFFGFHVQYSIEEHPSLWSAMMELPEVARNAWRTTITSTWRRVSRGEGILSRQFPPHADQPNVKAKNPQGGAAIDLGKLELDGLIA